MLSEMIKKREKHKLALVSFAISKISYYMTLFKVSCTESLMSSLRPASIIMRDTLEKLVEKDHQNVFTNPVSEEEVPGYQFNLFSYNNQ